jgi:uncharacterized membrane protein
MRVNFRNNTAARVWVAIMRWEPDGCRDYGNWATAGWWQIDPGQRVWAFSTNNRYAAFYAKSANGSFWAGDYGPVYVYHEAFDSCLNIGSTAAYGTVGMRLITLGDNDIVVNLNP